jgi:hypothetical protein
VAFSCSRSAVAGLRVFAPPAASGVRERRVSPKWELQSYRR